MALLSFADALTDSRKYKRQHALLGNGFSIACRPNIFTYSELYEQADFTKISVTAKLAFTALGTQDFEKVIKALRDAQKDRRGLWRAARPCEVAGSGRGRIAGASGSNDCGQPPFVARGSCRRAEYSACRKFLSNFENVYTFNYDLLLYCAQMHVEEQVTPLITDDGFRTSQDDYDASYVVWEPDQTYDQNTWFLHGALHLFDWD